MLEWPTADVDKCLVSLYPQPDCQGPPSHQFGEGTKALANKLEPVKSSDGSWSAEMLQASTKTGDPNACFYALFAGARCESTGQKSHYDIILCSEKTTRYYYMFRKVNRILFYVQKSQYDIVICSEKTTQYYCMFTHRCRRFSLPTTSVVSR